jgi:oligopeptide transport system substrate-binding protein
MQAEKLLIDEMPIAPIYFYTGSYMKKPYVKNVQISALADIDFKTAYVEVQ